MIPLTRFNGSVFVLNADLIETVEATRYGDYAGYGKEVCGEGIGG
jgi:hypothetical protein